MPVGLLDAEAAGIEAQRPCRRKRWAPCVFAFGPFQRSTSTRGRRSLPEPTASSAPMPRRRSFGSSSTSTLTPSLVQRACPAHEFLGPEQIGWLVDQGARRADRACQPLAIDRAALVRPLPWPRWRGGAPAWDRPAAGRVRSFMKRWLASLAPNPIWAGRSPARSSAISGLRFAQLARMVSMRPPTSWAASARQRARFAEADENDAVPAEVGRRQQIQ